MRKIRTFQINAKCTLYNKFQDTNATYLRYKKPFALVHFNLAYKRLAQIKTDMMMRVIKIILLLPERGFAITVIVSFMC